LKRKMRTTTRKKASRKKKKSLMKLKRTKMTLQLLVSAKKTSKSTRSKNYVTSVYSSMIAKRRLVSISTNSNSSANAWKTLRSASTRSSPKLRKKSKTSKKRRWLNSTSLMFLSYSRSNKFKT